MNEARIAELKLKTSAAAGRMNAALKAGIDEGRSLTTAEQARFDAAQTEANGYVAQMKKFKADDEILNQAKQLAGTIGGPLDGSGETGRKGWAGTALKALRGSMTNNATGQKALVSGVVNMVNPVAAGIVTETNTPRTILDLLRNGGPGSSANDPYGKNSYNGPVQQTPGDFFGDGGGSNTFSYLRQTLRENNATVVADNALKPTSKYTFGEVEDRYRVIAHLSEPIPQRYFHDDKQLGEFLASEMAGGLEAAVERQVLFGAGPGEAGTSEEMTGILNTSGILTQAFLTDQVTTSRKALTKLQMSGITPTAWALHPQDAEAFDLLREGVATGQYVLGGPSSDASKILWQIPTAISTEIPAGTALLADWTQGKLLVRQEATLHVDTSGELFTHNQVKFRVEGRYGLAMLRPQAFVKVALTA